MLFMYVLMCCTDFSLCLLTMRTTRSRWSLGRQPAARLDARVLCVRRKINRAWHQYHSKRARIAGLLGQSVPGIGLWEDAAASGQFLLHHRSSVVRRA